MIESLLVGENLRAKFPMGIPIKDSASFWGASFAVHSSPIFPMTLENGRVVHGIMFDADGKQTLLVDDSKKKLQPSNGEDK